MAERGENPRQNALAPTGTLHGVSYYFPEMDHANAINKKKENTKKFTEKLTFFHKWNSCLYVSCGVVIDNYCRSYKNSLKKKKKKLKNHVTRAFNPILRFGCL